MDCSKPTTTTRKPPCFLQDHDDDDVLASFRSFRSLSASSRSQPHFLDSCFLCRKPLGDNTDIFMYRGDTPFCTQDCRQHQIDIDEAKQKKWKRSSSPAIGNKEHPTTRSTSPTNSSPPPDYPFRAGTVAAA